MDANIITAVNAHTGEKVEVAEHLLKLFPDALKTTPSSRRSESSGSSRTASDKKEN